MNALAKLLIVSTVIGAAGCSTMSETAAQTPPAPACTSAAHRQFDFWVGEWDVVFTANGRPAGHSIVELLYGQCALRENWTGEGGYSGGSLNAFDPASERWTQTWIGSDGGLVHYVGQLREGAMVFLADGAENGRPYQMRMTFTPIDGNVRQYIERTNDAGATWAAEYDLTYRPVAVAQ